MRTSEAGTTLVETIVALSIAVVIIGGITSLVITSLGNATYTKVQDQAESLAQEGIETVRQKANSNYSFFVSTYNKTNYCMGPDLSLIERAFDIKIDNIWPKIEVDENDKKLANDFLKKNKVEKYVVFSPGATSDTKRWPEKKFDKLIDLFHKKYPKHKILISGAGNDEGMIKRLSNNRKSFCVPVVNFNLRGMSVIFGKADCVIANDGVATDISWVSGGNLIELSGPVDRKVFGPLRNTKIIYHDIHCNGKTISCPCDWSKPCIKPGGVWCMNLIELNEVMSAINDFINNKKRLKTLK